VTGRNPTTAHWAGRHVVVTGGTSGIGLATTRILLAYRAKVTAIGLHDAFLDRLAAENLDSLVVTGTDVTKPQNLHAAVETGRAAHGPVGALISCAGITRPAYFEELTPADHRRHMEVNYFGTLNAVQEVLPDLKRTPNASITLLASAAGFVGVFGYSAYCASKFAVSGLGEVLRQELRPQGVSVTVVSPPDVDTPMLAGEQDLKPPELRALSSGEKPLTAEAVATALLRGTAAHRARVLPDFATRLLRFTSGAVPGLLARYMDRAIRRAAARKVAA
jgi:3-dehydrosphinganine reductase